LYTPAASGHAGSVWCDDAENLGEETSFCTDHCWRCCFFFVRRQELMCVSVWPWCCCWWVSTARHQGLQRSSCTQTRLVTSSLTYLTLECLAVDVLITSWWAIWYSSVTRPVLEYCAIVCHHGL